MQKKNMLKKIKYFLIASSLIIPISSTLTNVSATSTEITQPRAAMCTCGGIFRPNGTSYTGWRYSGDERKCTHYSHGLDHEQYRTKNQIYTCERCSGSYTTSTKEYKWVCKGYNL